MKKLFSIMLFAATAASALAGPLSKKITNREFEDGTWSSKETDPETRTSIEKFYKTGSKSPFKTVRYVLDERGQMSSSISYDSLSRITQKAKYTLDGADRILQEVIYDARNNLIGTNNYIYGTRGGASALLMIDRYDANGQRISRNKKVDKPVRR